MLLSGIFANSVSAGVREPNLFVSPANCQPIAPRLVFLPSPIDANAASYGPASYGMTLVAGQLFAPPQLPQGLPSVIDKGSQVTATLRRQHGPIVLLPDPTNGPFTAKPFSATQPRSPVHQQSLNQPLTLNQPQPPTIKPRDRVATRRVAQSIREAPSNNPTTIARPFRVAPSTSRRALLDRKISQVRSLLNSPQHHWPPALTRISELRPR